MDKIIKTSLGIFIVILVVFTGVITYTGYTEKAYRDTLTGTYTYSCTITMDSPLYNVTFFIPVPADRSGNSPVVSAFSSHTVTGVPAGWETTLFDTGKSTMVRVSTPAIIPPEGTSSSSPYTITIASETTSGIPVDTRDPIANSAMFRPVQDMSTDGDYTTSLYADYTASPDTAVIITSAITGKNTWKIFEPQTNEYHTEIRIALKGENHGWVVLDGELTSGKGSYDVPGS